MWLGRERSAAPRPWRVAFEADPALAPIVHLLLGMNAHINFDLPQALLAVITDAEFDDPGVIGYRAADHARIDAILASRVPEEDRLLEASEQPAPVVPLAVSGFLTSRKKATAAELADWVASLSVSLDEELGGIPVKRSGPPRKG